jgi:hypothetical protein
MNKFEFISHLLENQKMNSVQKERFLKLASKEIGLVKPSNEDLWEEIEKIKQQLKTPDKNSEITTVINPNPVEFKLPDGQTHFDIEQGNLLEKNQKSTDALTSLKVLKEAPIEIDKKEYLNPKYLYEFLLEYNQDSILKYTCHTIDSQESLQNILNESKTQEYDYLKHLEIIQRNFNKLNYKYKGKVLKNILGLMSTYLGTYNKGRGWSKNIRVKWGSEELELWCAQNIGKVPNPLDAFQTEKFRFQTIELKNGSSLSNFSDLVIYFKHLFHIKNTNPLKLLIEESIFYNFNNNEEYRFLFDEGFSHNIDLFTYTEALIQAFDKIIVVSKEYHGDEILDVKLYFGYDENNLKEFKIVILNSKLFGKNFSDFRPGEKLTPLIDKQINGLCNFYIKAFFEDKKSNGVMNVWNGKQKVFKPCDEEIEGVEFILKMY